jgi:hypothetical protein
MPSYCVYEPREEVCYWVLAASPEQAIRLVCLNAKRIRERDRVQCTADAARMPPRDAILTMGARTIPITKR